MNVLLVDDQKIERELVKQALYSSGGDYDITEVTNAYEGLSQLTHCRYDVILMDYQMPKMDGMQLLVKIQSLKQKHRSTIIVISNDKNEDLMVDFINAGAHDFLLKEEITSSQLTRCIKQSQKRLDLETRLKESYDQVKNLAERDQLTGLFNRHHFEESLASLLTNRRGLNGAVAVMLLDLDNFKMINDSLGHIAGDAVLVELANRLRQKFRESQLFARLGGDEFAFVFTGIQKANSANRIAERILSSFDKPFIIDDQIIRCSGSLGIALNPCQKLNKEELIKRADIAMYKAKAESGIKACLFEDNMENEFFRCYKIENELRDSILKEEFEMHFQPMFNCQTKVLEKFEALVRWPSGVTTQNPQEFIQVAEDSRLIELLGRWIIKSAFVQYAECARAISNPNLQLAINLSPLQIHDLNLPRYIAEQAANCGLNLTNITIEVTETALLENNDCTLETLSSIRALGCQIALDDFGTGFSSISHLLNYPIDIVKFDRSLLERILDDNKARLMLSGMNKMLTQIHIATVAEGVEQIEQVKVCESIGITLLQGYLLGKPMSGKDCIKLFSKPKLNS